MKTVLRKTLLAALPLAGLLLTAPAAFAGHHYHYYPHYQGYRSHCFPRYDRGWYDRGRYNDYYYRPGWYDGRRYYDDDYYRSRYPRPFYHDPLWWYGSIHR